MSVVEWATNFFKPVGSAKSVDFDITLTPQLRVPIECADDGVTRSMTLIKPVQTGGSSAGEIAIAYWLSHWTRGDVGYFWQSDLASETRWVKYTERRLKACIPVMNRFGQGQVIRFGQGGQKWNKCLVNFPSINLVMQGVFSDRTVASDSFRGMVLEEVHDEQGGWVPGRVAQAEGRATAYSWDSIIFIISNAGKVGSELHKRFDHGTREYWTNPCPVCGRFCVMHAEKREDGSGLLYDLSVVGKDGEPDWNKLAPTIRYRFECGHELPDNLARRRDVALAGTYSEPMNKSAPLTHRSFTYEAIACADISWSTLIKEKHAALAARKRGDPRMFRVYVNERECRFVSEIDDRPEVKPVTVSVGRKKARTGLADRAIRLAAADYQGGRDGDLPHFWCAIRDFKANGDSLLVWEGRCADSSELVGTLKYHEVEPLSVCLDSGFEARNIIYPLCLSQGYCAIKVEGERSTDVSKLYRHADGSEHPWSEPQMLYVIAGVGPTKEDPTFEPRFWLVSKWQAMELLAHLRSSETKWEVPEDVSEDYQQHMRAWSYTTRRVAATGELIPTWKIVDPRAPDHLYQCEVYLAVSAAMERLIGVGALP